MINSFIYPNENFYQHKTSSCNSFDISSDIFHFSYQVYAWRKSQYLFYDQRKCTFIFRSSHWRSSVKKDVLQNFAKFTGKVLCQKLFFIRVCDAGVFLWVLQNFWEYLFYRTPPDFIYNTKSQSAKFLWPDKTCFLLFCFVYGFKS